ncbi:MAG: thiamine-phosphate kinase [Legionella sp.]|nr:thiamine-phosphate kinase [Legionella sp.]
MLSESNIIQALQAHFPEQIGDDAACMPLNQTQSYLISKDLLIEDTHFRLRYQDAKSLAHKALHVNLSDLAAMGATPQFVLLGLSIPPHFEPQTAEFLEAFSKACKDASVILIGGDTTRSSKQLMLSITAIGIAPHTNIKYRKHAKPNDLLMIAGNIGHAHLGLIALEQNKPELLNYKKAFLSPTARIPEGIWLGKQAAVTSMMDTSDGLSMDLERLCQASKLTCEVNLDKFEPNADFQSACKALKLSPRTVQLSGGEDYGLMFSVESDAYQTLTKQFKQQFKYDLKCIGKMKAGQTITWLQNMLPISLNIKPFLHFE